MFLFGNTELGVLAIIMVSRQGQSPTLIIVAWRQTGHLPLRLVLPDQQVAPIATGQALRLLQIALQLEFKQKLGLKSELARAE